MCDWRRSLVGVQEKERNIDSLVNRLKRVMEASKWVIPSLAVLDLYDSFSQLAIS